MIELGANAILFVGDDLETAFQHIAWAGYDGVEISAIKGHCENLVLDNWKDQVDDINRMSSDYGLKLLSMEAALLDEDRLQMAFEAAQALGIPLVNVGPGGKSGDEGDFERQTVRIAKMADRAIGYGVTLCVKAHVGQCIYNTPTTLRAMEKIQSEGFGIDMDPSHLYRAGENPEEALPPVLSRTRHIHIRDCKGRGPGPGKPEDQACGRGDIDLVAYCKALVEGGYSGPVCLEVIGAEGYSVSQKATIAAESYGYLNAVFEKLGAR
jgi:sugar phosphate isomerase/epimerase